MKGSPERYAAAMHTKRGESRQPKKQKRREVEKKTEQEEKVPLLPVGDEHYYFDLSNDEKERKFLSILKGIEFKCNRELDKIERELPPLSVSKVFEKSLKVDKRKFNCFKGILEDHVENKRRLPESKPKKGTR